MILIKSLIKQIKLPHPQLCYSFGSTIDLYQKIKEREMKGIRNNKLNEESIQKYYQHHRCEGCNSTLQSADKHKYGYIQEEVLNRSVKDNVKIIENTYG